MAGAAGFSHTTIRCIWTAFGLQPRRLETGPIGEHANELDPERRSPIFHHPLGDKRCLAEPLATLSLRDHEGRDVRAGDGASVKVGEIDQHAHIACRGLVRKHSRPVDTGTAAGKALLDMRGVFAEFETNLRRERQLKGIKAAKAKGIYKGHKPSIDPAELRRLRDEEKLGPAAIARRLKIGRASVYRVLGKSMPT